MRFLEKGQIKISIRHTIQFDKRNAIMQLSGVDSTPSKSNYDR